MALVTIILQAFGKYQWPGLLARPGWHAGKAEGATWGGWRRRQGSAQGEGPGQSCGKQTLVTGEPWGPQRLEAPTPRLPEVPGRS